MGRERKHVIRRASELRAMQSPVRQRMIAVLERDGPLTVREMAERLGRSPESLYHHCRILVDAGLLLDRGERPATRRPERVYELVARVIVSDPHEASPAFVDALAGLWASALRYASRTLTAALRDGVAVRAGAHRNCGLSQMNVRLGRQTVRELHARLDDLKAFVAEHDDPEADDFYSITFVVAPSVDEGESS